MEDKTEVGSSPSPIKFGLQEQMLLSLRIADTAHYSTDGPIKKYIHTLRYGCETYFILSQCHAAAALQAHDRHVTATLPEHGAYHKTAAATLSSK